MAGKILAHFLCKSYILFYCKWYRTLPLYATYRFDYDGSRRPDSLFSVVVGAHEINNANETSQRLHQVQRIVMHDEYLEHMPQYDIMLLQLKTSIEFNSGTWSICVDASVFPSHTKCVVTGWGSTTIIGRTTSFVTDIINFL